jgi:hypothetical protein
MRIFDLFRVIVTGIIYLIALVTPGYADNQLNGSAPRPFYIFGHNPNTVADAENALKAGANALEPDITLAECKGDVSVDNLVDWDSSFPNWGGSCDDTKLSDWLDGVHDLAIKYPSLALVVFDVKSSAATSEYGPIILNAIRTHLNGHGVGSHFTQRIVQLPVIISVATKSDLGVFDYILSVLDAREGVQVDAEDDAGAVVNYFLTKGYYGNIAFGDGTAVIGPKLITAMDGASGLRAAIGYPRAVTYVYTLNNPDSMRLFLDAGVDGIIPGDISALKQIVAGRSDIRMATRNDNPFAPPNEAYALRIRTASDESGEGTDANLTFTLVGAIGSATTTVNTKPVGRMERGGENWVTIPSTNLGSLTSVSVFNGGGGNKPDWKLEDLTVYSARWLRPDVAWHYTIYPNTWINGHETKTFFFRKDEYVWGAFTNASSGTELNPWKRINEAYNAVAPSGTIHVGSGQYLEKITITKPCTISNWSAHATQPTIINGQ